MNDISLVITGMGAVTPIGIGVADYWQNLVRGVCGISEISRFDASLLPVHIAAEIKSFAPLDHLPRNVVRETALFLQYALVAAKEALEDAFPDNFKGNFSGELKPSRIGVTMGTALGGVAEIVRAGQEWPLSKTHKVSPHFVPAITPNMAAAQASIALGLTGPSLTLSTACSAGGDAIMAAAMLLRSGEADMVLVMGGESIICPAVVSSLAQARALSRNNQNPKNACRPFDLERDGFVIGEGGGAIILETREHARKRKAKIRARLAGYASTLDAHHITAPDPKGKGAALCMQNALKRAGLKPENIDYINAHGTATALGDKAECLAIHEVFGVSPPPVSSTKGATGHLMGAGGITELIVCIKAIEENILPPTLNHKIADPALNIDCVPNTARNAEVNMAMSNSLGFGGQNSCIIVSGYEAQEKG